MEKYDTETTQALKDSIKHHENNLHKLRTAEGEFENNVNYFIIGTTNIPFNVVACALCSKYFKKGCNGCPLNIKGYKCGNNNSLWQKISDATTRPEAIKAEENMVRVLKKVLGEEEFKFKVGDNVWLLPFCDEDHKRIVVGIIDRKYMTTDCSCGRKGDKVKMEDFKLIPKEDTIFKVGDRVRIIKLCDCSHWANCEDSYGKQIGEVINLNSRPAEGKPIQVKISKSSRCSFRKDQLQKEAPMTQYDSLKQRIGNVKAWDKEADDIIEEMTLSGKGYCIVITCYNKKEVLQRYIGIKDNVKTQMPLEEFYYSDQCEKLEAFKKALMWLLDNSSIAKTIVGSHQQVKIEGKVYEAEIIKEV